MKNRLDKFFEGIRTSETKIDITIDSGRPRFGHYQGRYAAYLREKMIDPKLNQIFFDEYDELPGTLYVTAWSDDQALGGVRIKLLDNLHEPSISTRVYGEALEENLDMDAGAIDVSRMFTVQDNGAEVAYIQFCLMRAIFKCAETYGVRYILAPVKAGHVPFYRKCFSFELIAAPISYPGLTRPIGLTCGDVPKLCIMSEGLPFMAESGSFPDIAANDFPQALAGVG